MRVPTFSSSRQLLAHQKSEHLLISLKNRWPVEPVAALTSIALAGIATKAMGLW